MSDEKVQHLGHAWLWQDGERWLFVTLAELAPEHAVWAQRMLVEGEEVFYIPHTGGVQFVRGAVEA